VRYPKKAHLIPNRVVIQLLKYSKLDLMEICWQWALRDTNKEEYSQALDLIANEHNTCKIQRI
jgi:hypothetical protein